MIRSVDEVFEEMFEIFDCVQFSLVEKIVDNKKCYYPTWILRHPDYTLISHAFTIKNIIPSSEFDSDRILEMFDYRTVEIYKSGIVILSILMAECLNAMHKKINYL